MSHIDQNNEITNADYQEEGQYAGLKDTTNWETDEHQEYRDEYNT